MYILETIRNLEMRPANGGKLRLRYDAEPVVNAKQQPPQARPTMREELQQMHQASEGHQASLSGLQSAHQRLEGHTFS